MGARRGVCRLCECLVYLNRAGLFVDHTIQGVRCEGSGQPSGIAPARPRGRRAAPSRRETALRRIADLARAHLLMLDALREPSPGSEPPTRAYLLDLETQRAHAERNLRDAITDLDHTDRKGT